MSRPSRALHIVERPGKRTRLKLNLPPSIMGNLQHMQSEIGKARLTPEPSIHSMVLKAIENYILDFEKKESAR